jgi:hypothetical protein
MSLPIVLNDRPDGLEIAAALMAVAGRYVEFRYVPQKQKSTSPSALAREADTIHKGEPDVVKGFLDPEQTRIWFAQTTGHWCVMLHTMNRQAKTSDGEWAKYGYEEKNYVPHTYRMAGIRLDTVMVADGANGKKRLFPMAATTPMTWVSPNAR